MALQYLYITEDLKLPDEKFQSNDEIDKWYENLPVIHHFFTLVGDCGRGKTHLALAMGKIGDVNVVDTLMELLLDYRTCFEVLRHLSKLDAGVLRILRDRVSKLNRMDYHYYG